MRGKNLKNQIIFDYVLDKAHFLSYHDTHSSAKHLSIFPFLSVALPAFDGSSPILRDLPAVSVLQDSAQLTLNRYITCAYPGQPFRFGKLLLLLPALRAVSTEAIETLFFKRTIGDIPIERIICDMYKNSEL